VSASGAIAAALTSSGLTWTTFDGEGGVVPCSAVTPPPGTFSSLDVTTLSDGAKPYVIAAGTSQDITIVQADTNGTANMLGSLKSLGGVGDLLAPYDGQHVAVASKSGFVAVTWLTSHSLNAGDPTGGWALLQCQ
jgi:hypothetical protein